jgi:hypothetical protein
MKSGFMKSFRSVRLILLYKPAPNKTALRAISGLRIDELGGGAQRRLSPHPNGNLHRCISLHWIKAVRDALRHPTFLQSAK